jgi:hypothetical protein
MKKDEVNKNLYEFFVRNFGEVDKNYNPNTDIIPQAIFRRHEIPIAEHLMSFKEGLIRDYMNGYGSLEEAAKSQGSNNLGNRQDEFDSNQYPDDEKELIRTFTNEDESVSNPDAWRSLGLRYRYKEAGIDYNPDRSNEYPTAHRLVQEFGDDCPIANYSYMAPNSVLHRHTGPENRTGEYIRIHIPLIIPAGDVFFECNGEEIDWSDIFAFDNQLVHSAHNLTNEHRLIFLIDIKRSSIGMPPGQLFNKDRQMYSLLKSFVRKSK